MRKSRKILLIVATVAVALFIGTSFYVGFVVALWCGVPDFEPSTKIATYNSPDEEYSLVFEQMGAPGWPYGPAKVRLTLKNRKGKTVTRVSAQIFNDGANASERNVVSVCWTDDAVVVVLDASEMEPKELSIAYDGS